MKSGGFACTSHLSTLLLLLLLEGSVDETAEVARLTTPRATAALRPVISFLGSDSAIIARHLLNFFGFGPRSIINRSPQNGRLSEQARCHTRNRSR